MSFADLLNENVLDPASFDAAFRGKAAPLAGVDEAGRGPLAGPVVAAAVILDPDYSYEGLGDSKKLSAAARDKAFDLIQAKAISWGWARLEAADVDEFNPLKAAMLAMARAVEKLSCAPALVLVDGNCKPPLNIPCQTVVKGDARSLSIGAASIMAKVIRDRIMVDLHQQYPAYGFDKHKGYGTKDHLAALRLHGPSACHRLSFRGVKPPDNAPAGFTFGE